MMVIVVPGGESSSGLEVDCYLCDYGFVQIRRFLWQHPRVYHPRSNLPRRYHVQQESLRGLRGRRCETGHSNSPATD